VLEDVVDTLECPHCGAALALGGGALRCANHHSFDVARQGYATLLPGRGTPMTGDTAAMIAARADFLSSGHFGPIVDTVAARTARVADGTVLDAGAGTGYYLASALDAAGQAGLALDVSKYACRRAARAHPRIGAVVADVWQRLPVREGAVSVVLNVFAPRNAAEMHRVLRPGGHLLVVTPNSPHLGELVSELGLLRIDERKQERLDEQFGALFTVLRRDALEFPMSLRRAEINAVVEMGPSAWHATRVERLAALPCPMTVTASATVTLLRRR
jgi:23S rRNA (guanine745-N1)-methyltransferase